MSTNREIEEEHDGAEKCRQPAGSSPPGRKPLNVVQWSVLLGLVLLSYCVFSRVGVQVVEVTGDSMTPTLHSADYYLLKKWVYLFREPHRSDVVVLADPDDNGFSVKRIVATGGETVLLKDGKVFVNGKQLEEPYLPPGVTTFSTTRDGEQMFRCGKDEYFVMGDNRAISLDSRTYGPVPRHNILGLILP